MIGPVLPNGHTHHPSLTPTPLPLRGGSARCRACLCCQQVPGAAYGTPAYYEAYALPVGDLGLVALPALDQDETAG
jgi:hypothetical protein